MLLKEIVELPSRKIKQFSPTNSDNHLTYYDAEEIENISVPDREIDEKRLVDAIQKGHSQYIECGMHGEYNLIGFIKDAIINSNIFKTKQGE